MRENNYHNETNRINWYVCGNLASLICLLGLDAQEISYAKISTFTVMKKEEEKYTKAYIALGVFGRVGSR